MLKRKQLFWLLILLTVVSLSIWGSLQQMLFDANTEQAYKFQHKQCILNGSIKRRSNTDSKIPFRRLSHLPKNDFQTLIDLNDFDFIMNQMPCENVISPNTMKSADDTSRLNTAPFLLVAVPSSPENFQRRLVIRETWGSWQDPDLRLIFLLGAVKAVKQQKMLEIENKVYADMVQGNFIDDYHNMTYKHVMGLKWASYYCPEARYILKADDDIFVNTPFLLRYLWANVSRHDLLFCSKRHVDRVLRKTYSKWYVSEKEYPSHFFPSYCSGYAIIYSEDIAFRLYQEAQKAPYFWIDDVHLTGILPHKVNITITSLKPFILRKNNYENILAGMIDIDNFLLSTHAIEEYQTRILWNLICNIR